VPASGECSGSTLTYCVNASTQSTDCSSVSKACAFDTINQKYACMGDTAAGCGSVTATPTCYGDILKWCQDGAILTENCPYYGEVCNGSACGAAPTNCSPDCSGKVCGDNGCGTLCGTCGAGEQCSGGACQAAAPADCGAIDAAGLCEGDVVKYCDAGNLVEINCAANNSTCEFDSDKGWYDCGVTFGGGGGPCGAVTVEGECAGNTLNYCDAEGVLQSYNCDANNTTCGYDTANSYYNCLEGGAGSECGGITYQGECQGGSVVYCENDALQTLDCAGQDPPRDCGWSTEFSYYDCSDASALPCAPACSGRVCGDDGCGGTCGACTSGQTCSGSGQCTTGTTSPTTTPPDDEACSSGSHQGTWLFALSLLALVGVRRRRRRIAVVQV
jgi:MYXO-CTERM domain-containing protein